MNPLVMSIINNPSAHQVNRADKMDKTLNVMAGNLAEKERQAVNSDGIKTNGNRGYGEGRKMGD